MSRQKAVIRHHLIDRMSPKTRLILFFIVFAWLVSFIHTLYPYWGKMQSGIYTAYTESVLEDKDLNIINQHKDSKMTWIVTSTYNAVTVPLHGVVNWWLPFFLYQKGVEELTSKSTVKEINSSDVNHYDFAEMVATAFFLLVLFIVSNKFILLFEFSSRWSWVFVFAGTPMWWFALVSKSDLEVTSACAVAIFLYSFFCSSKSKNKYVWVLLGIYFGLVSVLRFSAAPYILLLGYLYYIYRGRWIVALRLTFCFLIGVASVWILYFINSSIQFGSPILLYLNFIANPEFTLPTMLIIPNGYLFISPLLILCAYAMFKHLFAKNKFREKYWFFLTLLVGIFFLKLILTNFRMGGSCLDEEFGPRFLLIDYAVLSLFLAKMLRTKKNIFLALCCVLWSLFIGFQYINWEHSGIWGTQYFYPLSGLEDIVFHWVNVFIKTIISLPSYFFDNFLMIPLFLTAAWMLKNLSLNQNYFVQNSSWNHYQTSFLMLFTVYGIVTIINYLNNFPNTEKLKQTNFFQKTVVANGFEAWSYDEVISEITKTLRLAKAEGNREKISKLEVFQKNYIEKVAKQIIIDPINFVDDFKNGIIRKSCWDP